MKLKAIGMVNATLLAVLLVSSTAQAGSYHVYSCRTPGGEAAPADRWTGSVAPGGAYDDYALDTCASGGSLVAALGDKTTHAANVDKASWAFEGPPWATVESATLWRAGYLHGAPGEHATYQFWMASPSPTSVFDECIFTAECQVQGDPTRPLAASNLLAVPSAKVGARLYASVSCGAGVPGSECDGGFTDPNGYAAAIYLFAADLVLEQTAGPTASNVSGELASASTVAGASAVTFTATDPGAGVYEAVVSLDGQVVQRTVLDEDGGRCRDVGQTSDGLPAFLYVQPCQPSVSADVALDTTSFTNGSHHLVISVTDAAGNSAPVLDRNITIANPSPQGPTNGTGGGGGGPGGGGTTSSPTGTPVPTSTPTSSPAPGSPNGVNASAPAALVVAWKGSTSSRLVSSYGRRRTVVGRLTAAGGTPIADAQVEVTATPSSVGAATAAVAQPHTAADGTFTYTVPASASSRTIRFAYRLHLGDPLPAASAALALSVPASIRLSISPRLAAVGRRIFFSGRLQGAPLPAGGKLLVLEARSGAGPWIKFNVIRSLRGGRFQASYRFRFPGPASYRFRVACESEADYPYAAGTSNTVVVRER